ncbi:MAG: hypothetical protein EAZ15_00310 [Sphingobacteriales bacterium]|nr:MAG: hypothetical protein EAZ15_00310 [Sphingobacteriales bacterium]
MDILLNKSKSSLEASTLLHAEELYASSVHCSYYSSVQLMRFVLFNKFEVEENEFDNRKEVKSSGSHNYLISFFRDKISKTIIPRDFANNLRDLKKLRKNADYSQKIIIERDSLNARKLADITNNALTKNFL